jgi:membrane protease YdiL (CAAX protease family)
VYRYFYRFSEPIDELIVKPLIFVLPVLYFFYKYEKPRTTLGAGFGNWGKIWGDRDNKSDKGNRGDIFKSLYLSIGLGMVLGAEGLFFNYLKYGEFNFAPVLPVGNWGLLGFLGLSGATAISEEVLGRGFLYGQLRHYLPETGAIVLSSLLFVLLHVPIVLFVLKLSGLTLGIYLFSVFILSIANCLLLRFTGSLLSPILVHAFWNMTIGLYL